MAPRPAHFSAFPVGFTVGKEGSKRAREGDHAVLDAEGAVGGGAGSLAAPLPKAQAGGRGVARGMRWNPLRVRQPPACSPAAPPLPVLRPPPPLPEAGQGRRARPDSSDQTWCGAQHLQTNDARAAPAATPIRT